MFLSNAPTMPDDHPLTFLAGLVRWWLPKGSIFGSCWLSRRANFGPIENHANYAGQVFIDLVHVQRAVDLDRLFERDQPCWAAVPDEPPGPTLLHRATLVTAANLGALDFVGLALGLREVCRMLMGDDH